MFNINQSFTHMARIVTIASIIGITYGCAATTQIVDTSTDNAPTMQALDYRDIDAAANAAIASLLESGRLDRSDGQRYTLNIDGIVNDTTQRINTDELTDEISDVLTNSGKVTVQTVSITQGAADESVIKARELDKSGLFKQDKIYGQQLEKPDLSLSGRITQRTLYMDSGKKQIEYTFTLRIADLNTGLKWWGMKKRLIKRSSSRASSW